MTRNANTSKGGCAENDALPAPILEAAADWHACLREPEPNTDLLAARKEDFDQWLAADPRHAQAYARIEKLWGKLEAPVAEIMRSDPVAAEPNRQGKYRLTCLLPRPAWAVASLAVLLVFGTLQFDNIVTDLRSDHMTAAGERAPLVLNDGSRVTLNTQSAITVDISPERRQVQSAAWGGLVRCHGK